MAGLFEPMKNRKKNGKNENKKSHPPGEFGYALALRQGRLRLGNSKSEEIFNRTEKKK